MPLTDYDYTDSLNNMFRESLKELVQVLRVSKDRGGVILAGVSGDIASYALEKELEKELESEWIFDTVKWRSDLKDLAELFPTGDPPNTLYFVDSLKVDADALALLNMTREFYLKEKKTIIYRLSPDDIFKQLQWKAADFWSFRTATFDFFVDEDYMNFFKESVSKELNGYEKDSEEIIVLEKLINLERKKSEQNKKRVSDLLSRASILYRDIGELEKALAYSQEALRLDRLCDDKRGEATDLGSIGSIFLFLGQPQTARKCHQQALDIADQLEDKYEVLIHLGRMGAVLNHLGEREKALRFHKHALDIAKQLNNKREVRVQLYGIGVVLNNLNRIQEALSYHKKALDVAEQLNDMKGRVDQYGSIGKTYYRLSQSRESLYYLLYSLELAKQMDYKLAEVNILKTVGKVYSLIGQTKKALSHLQTALEFYQKIGNKIKEKEIQKTIREIKKEKKQ